MSPETAALRSRRRGPSQWSWLLTHQAGPGAGCRTLFEAESGTNQMIKPDGSRNVTSTQFCCKCFFFSFSPPVRWGLLDFMYADLPSFTPSSSSSSLPSSSPDVARCQHGPPECSGQCRTSIGSSKADWAMPDLNRGAPKWTGQCRTSTRELQSGLGNAGPQPGSSNADWATPDLSRGPSERSGQRRTSAARRYVRRCVRNMSEKNVRKNVRRYVRRNVRKYVKRNVRRYVKRIQKICQKICQKYVRQECQKICQKICQ